MNKFIIPIIVVILIIIGIFLFSGSNEKTGEDSIKNATDDLFAKLSTLEFTDYDGVSVTLADFAGKNLIVNSWAAWCPFCRKELPDFVTIQKEFGDKITIIAIDRAEPLGTAKQYSDELDVTGDLIFLLDPDDAFYRKIGGFSMPETIFINANGVIKDHKRGVMSEEEVRRRVREAFNL